MVAPNQEGAMPDTDTTDTTDAATATTEPAAKQDEKTTTTATATVDDTTAETKTGDELGDAGKAAIAREREARKQAEREARNLKARLDAIDAEKLSEVEKLQKRAEAAESKAQHATTRGQRANLLTALTDEGLTGKQARAAARLLDGVEFDEDGEPTNLADALTAARAEYGDEMFAPRAATAATDEKTTKEPPDTHAGVRKTAEGAKPETTGWFNNKFDKAQQT